MSIRKWTLNSSPFKHKRAKDTYEMRTYAVKKTLFFKKNRNKIITIFSSHFLFRDWVFWKVMKKQLKSFVKYSSNQP